MSFERNIASEIESWLNSSFLLIPTWKWIAIVLFIALGMLGKSLLTSFFQKLKHSPQLRAKSHGFILHFLNTALEAPLAWLVVCLGWLAATESLTLTAGLTKYLNLTVQLILAFHLIRLTYIAVEAFGKVLEEITAKTENTLDDQLAPLATKTLKVFVVIFGFLIVLQNMGVNVMSLLAGLGLGGLALALAAQDTAANLFGSITIILDRPFQVGDWIKVAGTEGFVEEIGFRSTRIRTMYRSVVTIPNSVMAKEQIDNMGARPMHRVRHIIGLTYETSEEKMKQFMDQLRYCLLQHPLIHKETVTVRFHAMGDFNLQILMNFFVASTDVAQEMEVQQEILFAVMKIAQDVKVEFAFPTATHLVKSV